MRSFLKKLLLRKTRLKIILYLTRKNSSLKPLARILSKDKLEAYAFENIKNYTLSQPQKRIYLYNYSKPLHYSVPQFDVLNYGKPDMHEVKGAETYAALFENATVIGGSNIIILENNKALYDIKYYDAEKKFFYNDQALRYYDDSYCLMEIHNSEVSFDTAIFLGGNFSWNYYHYIYDILVKFEQIDKMGIDMNVPFLVDKVCLKVPQYSELLGILNNAGRKVISIDKGYKYVVKQLYYFSCPNIIPPDFIKATEMKAQDILFDLTTIDYLRLQLLPKASKKTFPKRIYISRKKASGRRKFNEDEVLKILSNYNFEPVFPEDLSLTEQITLFNNAEFIAGGSGAAFTNLLFCSKNCKVIIFMKKPLQFSGFSTIAKHVGADLIYITQDITLDNGMKNLHEAFNIDSKKFSEFVSKWALIE